MNVHLRDARDFLVSLRLTLALLVLSVVLVFAATLDQVNLGIWAVQEKYFRSFVIYTRLGGLALPVFPGGYTIGGLLLVNLVAAHASRFAWRWRKLGLALVHAGLIVLLIGELLSGLWQQDFHLRLDEGETKNYAEGFRTNELAIVDVTDPVTDQVVAVPEEFLARKTEVAHPRLPFRVVTRTYYPNSTLQTMSHPPGTSLAGAPDARLMPVPLPLTFKQSEQNAPSAVLELIGPDQSIGTFLVSVHLAAQGFEANGRRWRIELRPRRVYYPFSLTLLKFSHDRYPGTDIPRNFSSRVLLRERGESTGREILIYMNNPLRHAGLTFYQAGFENNDRTTVLQVVRNPSWVMPYVACGMISFGLLLQFGNHLVGFARRRRGAAKAAAQPATFARETLRPQLATALAALAVVILVAPTLRAPRDAGEAPLAGFAQLPVLVHGRIKPVDTVARTSLLVLQGRQRVTTANGAVLPPAQWLLDVLFRPEKADEYPVFEVVHPEALSLMAIAAADGAGGKRFSFRQLRPRLPELDAQARLAQSVEAPARTSFQRSVIRLRDSVLLYQRLQTTVHAADVPGFLPRLLAFAAAPAAPEALADLAPAFRVMDSFGHFRPIPPPGAAAGDAAWLTAGAAWSAAVGAKRVEPAALNWARLGQAWREQDLAAFERIAAEHHAQLAAAFPSVMARTAIEWRFNGAQPFYTSLVLYAGGFLLAVLSWIRWPQALGRAALVLVSAAFALATAGIATRMWLESRPPVTNLYSSALFVGWGAVALCLVLEFAYRNAIASATAGVIGFATLLIAHHLSLGGDTLEMMRAVLDSNFWLATHVVTVTAGYAATFLAGFLGLLYVFRGVFTTTLDRGTADALSRMTYGIVCFATLFSFVGTVLGGIWADQSWGRFWGWDPKENGALLIVIWNAVILHARWGGLVGQRGIAALAIFGNIVTAWSWFGVNMLGIGLHSYGFMDAAFWWLVGFAASQAGAIAMAALPLARWRSFREPRGVTSAAPPAPATVSA